MLVVLAAPAVHAEQIKVAVVLSVAVNIDPTRVDALTQDLAAALATELEVDAVGGLDARRTLPAEGLPPDCVTLPSCAADVARRTGATQLLFLVIVDSGTTGAVRVEATWIEPSSGHQASRAAIELASTALAEARTKFAKAAHELLPDAPLRGAPRARVVTVAPLTPPVTPPITPAAHRRIGLPVLIVGGVAVLALGAAIVTSVETVSHYRACDRDPTCTDADARRGSIRTLGYAADVTTAIAAGAAIATVILYVTSRSRVVIVPTAEGAAISMSGRF